MSIRSSYIKQNINFKQKFCFLQEVVKTSLSCQTRLVTKRVPAGLTHAHRLGELKFDDGQLLGRALVAQQPTTVTATFRTFYNNQKREVI